MAEFPEFGTAPAAPASMPSPTKPTSVVRPQDLPDAKGKSVVKDPSSGEVYPADSDIGKKLIEDGFATPYFMAENNNKPSDSDSSAFYQQGLAPVKAMQQSLINLSREIADHPIQNIADRENAKGEILNGANSFMNFLVSAYMKKAKTSGQQLVDTDEKQPTRMNTGKENDNFKGVLKTIARIGSPGAETKPDGNWGPRTNNALKQIYALAYALVGVQQDMGVGTSEYTDADLAQLYANIPQNISQVNVHDKVRMAMVLSKNLDKLRALYDNFREKVLGNKTYAEHISQEKPLMINTVEQKQGNQVLSQNELSAYEANKSTELDTTLNGHKITVMPYNLYSMDAFKAFLKSKAPEVGFTQEQLNTALTDNVSLQHYLGEVANGIK